MFGGKKDQTAQQDGAVEVSVFGPFSLEELEAKFGPDVAHRGELEEFRNQWQLARFDTVVGLIEAFGDNWGGLSKNAIPGTFAERVSGLISLATYIEGGISSLKEAVK